MNVLAVLVAAVSSFLLGGVWYSKAAFGEIWTEEAGRGSEPQRGHPAKVFAVSFLFALVAAAGFALLLGPNPPFLDAVFKGLLAGVCFVMASFGINYQFAERSTTMWLIDGGYHAAQFLLFGIILGLWH